MRPYRCEEKLLFHRGVVSKLRYGISSMWLGVAEQRKLDGFYCRCLRRILHIMPAYISRISNDVVLQRAGQIKLSTLILKEQLLYLSKVASAPAHDLLRNATFLPHVLVPRMAAFVRKVGRPRHTWAEQLLSHAVRLCSPQSSLESMLANTDEWHRKVGSIM